MKIQERVLGIDPGVKSVGLAYRSKTMGWRTWRVPLSEFNRIKAIMDLAFMDGVRRVAIEWGPDGRARDGKPMLQARLELLMLWAGIAKTTKRIIVYPTQWQSACGLIRAGKEAHIKHARLIGANIPNGEHDMADAVCIAAYAENRLNEVAS